MIPAGGFYGVLDPFSRGRRFLRVGMSLPTPPTDTGPLWGTAWSEVGTSACWYATGDVGVAFHGEIHNARDLCQQLGLPVDTPLPRVLLSAWQQWPDDFQRRFDGVFALALRRGDELLLCRDPSGLRNLYYCSARGAQIAFATHLDTLQHLTGTARRPARHSLHEYLRFGDIAAPNTIYAGVRAVEAGQLLRWTPGGDVTPVGPGPGPAPASPADFAGAVDALDAHLQRSVLDRLGDVRRPAAFLSGGIDSALLCAIAARHRPDTTAVTVGFDAAPYDESPVARRIASHLGIAHEVLRFGRAEHLAAFERLGQHMEQPMADPATPATMLAFERCHRRFDTLLDGTGADEALGMMPPRHVRLAVGHASLLPLGVRRGLTRWLRATPGLSGYGPIVDFEHPAETMIRWNGFTRPEIAALCEEPVSFAHTHFFRTFERFPRRAHFERYSALMDAMPSERMNQATLITGAPIRYPFWGRETNDFLRSLPVDFRYLPGQPKRILRALLARYVPREIWNVPKHGFNFPLQEFLAADDFALVRRYLDPAPWRQSSVLSVERVEHYARRFMAGDRSLAFRVWALVMLGAWLEKHDELL